jgi:hypothetical protein
MSGGIIITFDKVDHSDSTPMDEFEALASVLGRIDVVRVYSCHTYENV